MSAGDADCGLYRKYRVWRIDGKQKGPYFVLAYKTDPHAATALASYAASCEKDYPQLAADLREALRGKVEQIAPADVTRRIGAEIRRLRGRRSAQWLSDETEKYGQRISRPSISELETGSRKNVSVAELIAFARSLDTTVEALMIGGAA